MYIDTVLLEPEYLGWQHTSTVTKLRAGQLISRVWFDPQQWQEF